MEQLLAKLSLAPWRHYLNLRLPRPSPFSAAGLRRARMLEIWGQTGRSPFSATAGMLHRSFVGSRSLRVRLRFLRMTAKSNSKSTSKSKATDKSVRPTRADLACTQTKVPRVARDDKPYLIYAN